MREILVTGRLGTTDGCHMTLMTRLKRTNDDKLRRGNEADISAHNCNNYDNKEFSGHVWAVVMQGYVRVRSKTLCFGLRKITDHLFVGLLSAFPKKKKIHANPVITIILFPNINLDEVTNH